MKKQLYFIVLASLFFQNCSQQVSPTGGKKDVVSPELVSSVPENKQKNYRGKTIELNFDEYVVADNLQQKLSITPDAGVYEVKMLSRGLRLRFKKDLDSNTTYSLAFGDAIKDFSEKNPVKNLRLVFSTGKVIDSASVAGRLIDVQTNQPLFDALVGLYKNSDTLNPEKIKPTYFTRTDSAGKYSIENIHAATYQLIAIDDKNRSMSYNPKVERIGYLKDSIKIINSTKMSDVMISLFYANYVPIKYRTGSSKKANTYDLIYDKGIVNYMVSFPNKADSVPYFRSEQNEIRFYNTKNHKDSITVLVTVEDSLGNSVRRLQKIKFKESKTNLKDKEVLTVEKSHKETEPIEPNQIIYSLTFNKPLAVANLDQIKMYSDSTKEEVLKPAEFEWENQKSKLTIRKKFVAKKELKIMIPKNTFLSIEGDTLPKSTTKLQVMEAENYATLSGEVMSDSATLFIVELINEENKVVKTSANQSKYRFEYLKPDTYYVRVIVDDNKNGRWDAGNYMTKKQPERIFF